MPVGRLFDVIFIIKTFRSEGLLLDAKLLGLPAVSRSQKHILITLLTKSNITEEKILINIFLQSSTQELRIY